MRIVLIGKRSFISQHVHRVAATQGLDVTGHSHDAPLGKALRGSSVVMNFAISPNMFTQAYSEEDDYDLHAAEAAAKIGARFVMCSTRRVYPADTRFGATETCDAPGDETTYGRNKAISESRVAGALGANFIIFRLSNVFGLEYGLHQRRPTFFSRMLSTLREGSVIRFDMAARTRRDFLPVEACANAIVQATRAGATGIYNLGCGFPVSCGQVAEWVIKGFGKGRLVAETDTVHDEFFLDMHRWENSFPLPIEPHTLEEYCVGLGRRLRSE